MSVQITYFDNDPFSGIAPVPFVSMDHDNLFFGGRWGSRKTYQLKGNLTGFCQSFQALISGQKQLISGFSKDFGTLRFFEDGIEIFTEPFVQVINIEFPESNYTQMLPFTVSLAAFDSGAFWQFFGVTEPKRDISIEDKEDGTYVMTQVVSARGFNTSGTLNNLENAKAWVQQYTGLTQSGLTQFFSGCLRTGVNIIGCLTSRIESIDRFNGTYSVTETYRVDPSGVILGLTKYSVDVSTSLDAAFTTVDVKGDITSCLTGNISDLRAFYSGLDTFTIANDAYFNALALTGLNPTPIKSGITEDYPSKRLTFDVVYNNDFRPNVYFDGTIEFKTDETRSLTSATLDGTIKARHGDLISRYAQVTDFYATGDFIGTLSGEYVTQGFPFVLYPKFTTRNAGFDPANGEIKVRFETSDRDSDANFNISVVPAVPHLVPIALLNGSYQVQQFPFKIKGQYSVKGTTYTGDPIDTGILLGLLPSGAVETERSLLSGNDGTFQTSIAGRITNPQVQV